MRGRLQILTLLSIVVAGLHGSPAQQSGPPARTGTDFAREIEPIFQKRCTGCHGAAQQMNGLRLDDGEAALKGSYAGPVIIPGKSQESKLIQRVVSTKDGVRMPPSGPPLSASEIDQLRAWIDSGAIWPASRKAKESKPVNQHWAFKPIVQPAPPDVKQSSWVRNPIDRFILSKLESESIAPSAEADRRTLLRRLSLDLTGLPPTPEEMAAWLADNRPDAWERQVDRLLASPHYGEKWARHWLDLAHYADSDGYEKDQSRPWAWRWRHWVIQALNSDMPFDQFTIAQLAGDLLPGATVDDRVATGFYRNTLTNREAGTDRAEARFEQLVNRTNTIGTVWLGLTVGCAQCHNHKYDPISQKEYYELLAFVNSADEQYMEAPLPGEIGPYLRARPEYDRKRQELLEKYEVPALQTEWEKLVLAALDNPGKDVEWDFAVTSMKAMLDDAEKLIRMGPEKRNRYQRQLVTDYFISTYGPTRNRDKEKLEKLKELRKELAALNRTFPHLSLAPVMVENPSAPKAYIAIKGDYREKGLEVEPRTPAVLPPLKHNGKPDRLALARWLVSRENPLTARVTVNRAWQEFFGKGLVRTSEDFGTQGERPSHPELLDWLAAEFMERGWSLKQLHRLIVTSATYRQSSAIRKDLLERDPDNTLLARQSRLRLQAELIRDSALFVSGLLNTEIGGRSVRPPLPPGVAELGYANSVKWEESQGPARYRRGLYIHFQRTTPYPQLISFDAPDSNVACSRRSRSNTPLQSLNLLNDLVFFEAAQAFALRILNTAGEGFANRIRYAFETALGRLPSPTEAERLGKYLDQQLSILRADPKQVAALMPVPPETIAPEEAAAWVGISRVLLNTDEFITRE